ncbi:MULTISPECIES: exo 1,3/1,4-beta-D-glucan glucohydrolase [unclassified Lysobacter]|uniref:glycoside hydrolase family 3 protein n=1 Tax=unclassified Lysobacter TaxID=2635362 RepID=UPI001F37062F|nr:MULTISPECIES: exo 1,3/1,4-beta-D-glucan glucohydrolase [unclassified Lysobacter]
MASKNPRARAAALRRGGLVMVAALGLTVGPGVAGNAPAGGTIHPERWPAPAWPLPADPALEARVDALLATMTLEEKVGQIVQGDISSLTPEDVRKYRLGSVLAGGGSDPGGKYNAAPAQWLAQADAFYEASMDTRGGGKAIPILYGIDAVHGQSNVVGATVFPHNIGLGAARNPELIREIGRITAIETRTTGMEWAFAPTVAVPQDDRWGRSYEGYSEDPKLVASYAGAMVEGLQGKVGDKEFLDGAHVVSSVKHYLGDGGTSDGKDQGDTQVDEAELRDVHNAGYPPAIAAGTQAVMISFSSYQGVKLAGHKPLVTDVLKGRMNFGGFVVTDWNAHGQVAGCDNTQCPATVNAGVDLVMAPDSWKPFYESTLAAAKAGTIPIARIDDAVRRLLRVKFRLGLFDAGKPSQRALGGKFELLGAPEHRAVARQAVRESLVLLKNQRGVLPLDPKQKLLIAGDGADSMAKQSGGWTLTWQGTGTTRADFPNAETIWEGLKSAVESAGGSAELALDGQYRSKPDAAIVVIGENPYAEFQGDLPTLLYKPGDDSDLQLIRKLKADGIPVVTVFLSGRPLWVNREINASDAFVAAWLPGSEGGGIADVLLRRPDGGVHYDFKGKLSFSWPRRADQYANNVGQKDYRPQFAYGYGLTYASKGDLAPLPETAGVSLAQAQPGLYYGLGMLAPGLSMALEGADRRAVGIKTLPAALGDGSIRIAAVDHRRQEDARRVTWSGSARARLALIADTAKDLTREANGDVQLMLTLRVDAPPQGDVAVGVACGEGCGASLPLRESLASLPAGRWTTLGIPLKCFALAGADLSKLSGLLAIETAAPLQLSFSRIALAPQGEAERTLACRTSK